MDSKCTELWSSFHCSVISGGLYLSYLILAVAVISAIGLAVVNTIKNQAVLIKSGIGIGILVVVLGISFALSDSDVSVIAKSLGWGPTAVGWIGAGLIMFYIALFVAIAGLVYSEISKAFK